MESCFSASEQAFSLWNGIVAIVDAEMFGNAAVQEKNDSMMHSTLEAAGVMGKDFEFTWHSPSYFGTL